MANNNEDIKTRMMQWAEWSALREAGAAGYPRECSYTRMQPRAPGAGFHTPDVDMDAMAIDRAVHELPSLIRLTVHEYYIRPGTIEQKARALRCNRDTVFARINAAHLLIPVLLESFRKKNLTNPTKCI